MPLIRLNATLDARMRHAFEPGVLSDSAALGSATGPAIVMVHGYKYAPGSDQHCPHRKIFSTAPHSWPHRLGFGTGTSGEGLGIAFGWYARGSLRGAHARAQALGGALAEVVERLRAQAPDRPVHIIAHSLGAEAALSALPHLQAGAVARMVLLTGASHAGRARALLDTPAGRAVDVLNVTSRENDVFDAVFERLIPSDLPQDRALGHGVCAPNVANVQLDCPQSLSALRALGFPVSAPERRICHWSSYRRAGVMKLYSAFLRAPQDLTLSRIAAGLPKDSAPRWSRLLTPPQVGPGLDKLLPRLVPNVGFNARALGGALHKLHKLHKEPKNEPAC